MGNRKNPGRNRYRLKFAVPTQEEIARLRQIHRDMTTDEKNIVSNLQKGGKLLAAGEISIEMLTQKDRETLRKLLDASDQE